MTHQEKFQGLLPNLARLTEAGPEQDCRKRDARRKAQGEKPTVISPLALEAVRRIDALFEIERATNGQSAERRETVRQELSTPPVADLKAWMHEQRARLSRGNDVAKAMNCMLKRTWRLRAYLLRLLQELEAQKHDFRLNEEDPESIGQLTSPRNQIASRCRRLRHSGFQPHPRRHLRYIASD